jgi:hypothetical protein
LQTLLDLVLLMLQLPLFFGGGEAVAAVALTLLLH